MSHQTGIAASEDLRSFFAKAKLDNTRLIKVVINDEELTLDHFEQPHGSWEADYDTLIQPLLETNMPCYILYRTDTHVDQGYEWILISYTPDTAPVRQKMLYAATRATLKKEFGGGQIKEEMNVSLKTEVALTGFQHHKAHKDVAAPLTSAEEELELIKRTEVNADISVDSKHQTMQGIAFPISDDAIQRLCDLRDDTLNYVQLSIDLERETIELESFENTTVHDLVGRIPLDHPRYHFFRYPHSHEGDHLNSIVFIYSMPGYSCSIKERMLYSSCKSPLLDSCEQQIGMEIAKKLEVDDPKEMTEGFLYEEVHPQVTIVRQQFAKPKPPGGRGARRMTKKTDP